MNSEYAARLNVTPGAEDPGTGEPKGLLQGPFSQFAVRERYFLMFLGFGFFLSGATYNQPHIAMWVGFAFAGYAAVANDSIQTIGTFIASNRQRPWWLLWLFIAGIFLATVTYSFVTYQGDVSYARLQSKGFAEAPTSFNFLQIAAPVFLILITRLRMPVSTTFLLLSAFTTKSSSLTKVLSKSLQGYVVAFVAAFVVWTLLSKLMQRKFQGQAHPIWSVFQWITSGLLWSVWLMQDAANIAVFLPRALSTGEFIAFASVIVLGLGWMLFNGGERIQEIIEEKSDVFDVRSATVIDFIYAIVLYLFKIKSAIPMSTTWVFLGLLAGRELGMTIRRASSANLGYAHTFKLAFRDVGYAAAGLLISLAIACAANPVVYKGIFG